MYLNPYFEFLARLVNFRLGGEILVKPLKYKRADKQLPKISLKDIEEKLKEYGIKKGDHIMIHSSLSRLEPSAVELVRFLKEYIGPEGAILMPTHPKLKIKDGFEVYDPKSSPSTVGYLTEYFRKSNGVKRSIHPYSSVAVWGRDSDWYLEDNLNDESPLPHGVFSPYYKLSLKNGIAVCIGVTAKDRATIKHVAEETLDTEFPLNRIFEEYKVEVRDDNYSNFHKVRKTKLEFSQLYMAKNKIRKEWLENNILKEYNVNNVPIHFVDCRRCVAYMMGEIKKDNTSYPLATKFRLFKND